MICANSKKIKDRKNFALTGKKIRFALSIGLITAALTLHGVAHAQYATGGTGAHKGRILWIDWGNNGDNVFAGKTITRSTYVDTPNSPANRLDISCTLSNAVATRGATGLFVYAPGNWQGDGLDELYNIGGNQPGTGTNPNTLTVGLATSNAATVEFDFSCSATLGGAPFALSGLVLADAEAGGRTGVVEYVALRPTGGGTVRVIDQISQCGSTTPVNVVGTEVRFEGSATHCQSNANPALRGGPALVGFLDGATSGRIISQGRGVSAVAVGAIIELEYSEGIPNTYGNASHVLDPTWNGGIAATGVNYNNPANLATPTYQLWLGNTVQPDADANGAIGTADVDALPKTTGPAGAGYANVAAPQGAAGSTYSINTVSCHGPGAVAGWIDFNGNGTFDAGEKSNVATCGTGASSVNLTWTIPTGGTTPQETSFMRLRAATDAASITNASGVANNGEAEDYRIKIGGARLRLQKTWVNGVANDSTTLQTTGLSNTASLSATTTTGNDSQQSSQYNVYVGETAQISEILGAGNAGFYSQALSCIGAADSDLSDGLTINALDSDITCTITNTRRVVTATNDSTTGINGVNGAASVLNLFAGDTVAGVAAGSGNATLSIASGSSLPAELTFNSATGEVGVKAGTPAGTYSFNYQICDASNPTNCTTATATVTVAPSTDLSITKTDGRSDAFSGDTLTYTVTVTNNGPDASTGAVVKDVVGAGLTCPAGNAVTISGNGVPAGSFTIADLTGSGITLGTLANGQTATLTYSCQVN